MRKQGCQITYYRVTCSVGSSNGEVITQTSYLDDCVPSYVIEALEIHKEITLQTRQIFDERWIFEKWEKRTADLY